MSVEQREKYAEEAYEMFVHVLPEHWGNIRFLTLDIINHFDSILCCYGPTPPSDWS